MMSNPILVYILGLFPGLGHIAIASRKKGYMFIFLTLAIYSIMTFAAKTFADYTLPVREAFALICLVSPLYLWAYTDLISEMALINKDKAANKKA
ncbi:MAG: hypothetical protein WC838_02280 [Candidatus Margulisiibacteriota bacterium]|jgi:hypothetical protein